MQSGIQLYQVHLPADTFKGHTNQMVPGKSCDIRICNRKAAILREVKRNYKDILFVQKQHIFRHNRDKGLFIASGIRHTVELPLYQKGFKVTHSHHVVLDGIKLSLGTDVSYEDSQAAILSQGHIKFSYTKVQLFQKVFVIFTSG